MPEDRASGWTSEGGVEGSPVSDSPTGAAANPDLGAPLAAHKWEHSLTRGAAEVRPSKRPAAAARSKRRAMRLPADPGDPTRPPVPSHGSAPCGAHVRCGAAVRGRSRRVTSMDPL